VRKKRLPREEDVNRWLGDKLVLLQVTQWKVIKSIHDFLLEPRYNLGVNKQAVCGDQNKFYNKAGLLNLCSYNNPGPMLPPLVDSI
jgi:hypothetical protein